MKSEIIRLEITQEDIEKARQLEKIQARAPHQATSVCPAAVALERVTGLPWKTLGTAMVMEKVAPFRIGLVPLELRHRLRQFETNHDMEPGCFVIMLDQVKE